MGKKIKNGHSAKAFLERVAAKAHIIEGPRPHIVIAVGTYRGCHPETQGCVLKMWSHWTQMGFGIRSESGV